MTASLRETEFRLHHDVAKTVNPRDEAQLENEKRGLFKDLSNPYDVDKESVGIGWWGLA